MSFNTRQSIWQYRCKYPHSRGKRNLKALLAIGTLMSALMISVTSAPIASATEGSAAANPQIHPHVTIGGAYTASLNVGTIHVTNLTPIANSTITYLINLANRGMTN